MSRSAELDLRTQTDIPGRNGINNLGLNEYELNRINEVSEKVGWEYALREYERNVASYEREFGADNPVSLPYNYHIINGRTYTLPVAHPLFDIEAGIDPTERDGVMIEGWRKFDALTKPANTQTSEWKPLSKGVNIWYSPHGDSGLGFEFDSGRLYVSVNTPEGSKHVNIKTAPSFDVTRLLDAYAMQANVQRPSFFTSNSLEDTEKIGMHYLANPFAMGLTTTDFFKLNQTLMEQGYIDPSEVVYTSRRNDPKNAQTHTFASIMQELEAMLQHELPAPSRGNAALPRTEKEWQKGYTDTLLRYAVNGTVELYGCSATSIFALSPDQANWMSNLYLFNPFSSEAKRKYVSKYGVTYGEDQTKYRLTCPFCGWSGYEDPCKLTACPNPNCNKTTGEIMDKLAKKAKAVANPTGTYM